MRPQRHCAPFAAAVLVAWFAMPHANAEGPATYTEAREEIAKRHRQLAADKAPRASVAREILSSIDTLTSFWLGTRWGLGAPQTSSPQHGKINCGTFVGTVLRDAGFEIDVVKLQRQPSQLIIESFVGRERMAKFSNASMDKFLARVREMGPGLFIIGLDFHVGFLIQTDDDLRFVHASYVTKTVVDEAAAKAEPIVTSRYRVVGKLLSTQNIADWLRGRAIRVKGKW